MTVDSRKPQRPRESSSSHNRPGSEAVTQPALTCRGLAARASRAFLEHRSSLVSSRCQARQDPRSPLEPPDQHRHRCAPSPGDRVSLCEDQEGSHSVRMRFEHELQLFAASDRPVNFFIFPQHFYPHIVYLSFAHSRYIPLCDASYRELSSNFRRFMCSTGPYFLRNKGVALV